MKIDNWLKKTSGEARLLNDTRIAKYFSHLQPQIALASVYTLVKTEKREFTVKEISLRSGIPYSTVRAILQCFEDFGLVLQVEKAGGRAIHYKASVHEIERLISQLAKGD